MLQNYGWNYTLDADLAPKGIFGATVGAIANIPSVSGRYVYLCTFCNSTAAGSDAVQMIADVDYSDFWGRTKVAGVWKAWKKFT